MRILPVVLTARLYGVSSSLAGLNAGKIKIDSESIVRLGLPGWLGEGVWLVSIRVNRKVVVTIFPPSLLDVILTSFELDR